MRYFWKKVTEAHCLVRTGHVGSSTLCSHLKIRFKEKFRPKYAWKCFLFFV